MTVMAAGPSITNAEAGQPACPACHLGWLEPHYVQIWLARPPHRVQGANYLDGWVAVCTGDPLAGAAPCGFTMPMTPHRYGR